MASINSGGETFTLTAVAKFEDKASAGMSTFSNKVKTATDNALGLDLGTQAAATAVGYLGAHLTMAAARGMRDFIVEGTIMNAKLETMKTVSIE